MFPFRCYSPPLVALSRLVRVLVRVASNWEGLSLILLLSLQTTEAADPLRLSAVFLCPGPGLNLAQSSLWLACAMSLAVFDIEKYVDGFGNVVEPKVHYSDGAIR